MLQKVTNYLAKSNCERTNALFLSATADPEVVTKESINLLHVSLKKRVCDNQGNELQLSRIDLGSKFLSESLKAELDVGGLFKCR